MTTGFNWGQMFHYITLQYNKQSELPKPVADMIRSVAPEAWLENVRFSGTYSNYMNLDQAGYGQHDNTLPLWAQISNQKQNPLQRIQFTLNVLLKNRAAIFKSLAPYVSQSYLYNLVATYHQLGCKTMAFTFNSHMPYIKYCKLSESIKSLEYVHKNTNLVSLELENETYLAGYIVGSKNKKDYEPKINAFLSFLEKEAIPAITSVIGKNIPLGISIVDERIAKYKYWNNAVMQLRERLIKNGYTVFLVPHVYTAGYTQKNITEELDYQINSKSAPDCRLRITEFNADSSAGNCSQDEAINFIKRFQEVATERKNIDAIYYHSLYTQKGAHFSFVK